MATKNRQRPRSTPADINAVRRIHEGGIPLQVIADEMGVSYHTVYYWLRGLRCPSYLVYERIRRFVDAHTRIVTRKGAPDGPR